MRAGGRASWKLRSRPMGGSIRRPMPSSYSTPISRANGAAPSPKSGSTSRCFPRAPAALEVAARPGTSRFGRRVFRPNDSGRAAGGLFTARRSGRRHVNLDAVAPKPFGAEHRGLGLGENLFRAFMAVFAERDADAERGKHFLPVHRERLRQCLTHERAPFPGRSASF